MKLRTAKKICKAIGTPGDGRYTGWQKLQAANRMDRTKSARRAEAMWHSLMVVLGPDGRKELAAGIRQDMDKQGGR